MSRLNIKEHITSDDILQSTNYGKEIFEKELGKISKHCINSPLRNDKNPSFSVFQANNGLWMYKDFSNGDSGTAIQFIQKRYNLDYKQALEYIQKGNFNIQSSSNQVFTQKIVKKDIVVDWVDQPFTDLHKRYFEEYELD